MELKEAIQILDVKTISFYEEFLDANQIKALHKLIELGQSVVDALENAQPKLVKHKVIYKDWCNNNAEFLVDAYDGQDAAMKADIQAHHAYGDRFSSFRRFSITAL